MTPKEVLEVDFQSNRAFLRQQFEGPLVYFADLGSVLTMGVDETIEIARRNLEGVSRVSSGLWFWAFMERAVYESDHVGGGLLASGHNANILDYRRELWINFASPHDAMLSRITLVDLRNARDVECGGRARGAE